MLKHLIFGGCNISIPIEQRESFLNMCLQHELVYNNLKIDKKRERVYFTCTLYTFKRLKALCLSRGIRISVDSTLGFPSVIIKNKHRYGILIGLLLMVFIVGVAQMFLWDIRVSGNSLMSEVEVIDQLNKHGLEVGSLIRNIDVDTVENRVLIDSEDISWISINLNGTVAFVEVREALPLVDNNKETSPANLVASKDGQIETIEVYEGNIKVKKGQLVRRGDILVSGIYDSLPWGYRYTRAKGNIIARTVSTLCIEIPYEYSEKIYTGDKKQEKNIVFFSKQIKLCRNTGFLGTTYDTIYEMDQLCFPDGIRLPLKWCTTTHLGCTYEVHTRSPEQAMDMAYLELDAEIGEMVDRGCTVLKKDVIGEIKDSSYVLTCTLTMLENISETVEFEVSGLMEDK